MRSSIASSNLIFFLVPGARLSRIFTAMLLAMGSYASAQDVQFNTDVLDVKDRENIDLSQFSQRGYIMPGTYNMTISLNESQLPEQPIAFYPPDNDPKKSEACLTPELIDLLGIKDEVKKDLTTWHQGQCIDIRTLKGVEMRGSLGESTLQLNIPQAYLEYSSEDWDPPSRWDDGIPGILLDYSVNAQSSHQQESGVRGYDVSGNGTVGANIGAWRLRADWQGRTDHQTGDNDGSVREWDWNRFYAYRAIPQLRSKLVVGEDYLNSDIFDSFRFTGASLNSDDNMLPPNLRGYAPEVSGVAKTNARVTVSQQGRVLYQTQVAAGPFRIQDLNNAVSGLLDIRVEEQDGSVQTFQVNTASIPYLTRPGQVRFKMAAGRASNINHDMEGAGFGSGEFSWGISNGWSLYGGGLLGGDYNAMSLGIGRDLLALGAISFDVTQSRATLPDQGTQSGKSYKVNYSKRFEEYDSQVTFAGYRFSEKTFMSMAEYLEARQGNEFESANNKEMYTVSLNKQFTEIGLSVYLNYYHQTYWNRSESDNYNLMLSRYFDIGRFKNINGSITAFRSEYNGTNDDGMYLSFSIPWGDTSTVSYNSTISGNNTSHNVSYYDQINDRNSYNLTAGASRHGAEGSAFYTHDGDIAQINANASYQNGRYSAVGLGMTGGATLTAEGGALHRSNSQGGTRLLLDTGGVAGIPVRGYGSAINSNAFGKVVVADISSYYRSSASIDLNQLADNAEAKRSVVQATLTEGAIGYRQFEVIAGEKAMAVIRMADGSYPPFGATVLNGKKQETGIVNDEGSVYLSGINAAERMTVRWNGAEQCSVVLPPALSTAAQSALLLPCIPLSGSAPSIQAASSVNAVKISRNSIETGK